MLYLGLGFPSPVAVHPELYSLKPITMQNCPVEPKPGLIADSKVTLRLLPGETPACRGFLWILSDNFPKVIETLKQKPPMKIKLHMFGSRQNLGPD